MNYEAYKIVETTWAWEMFLISIELTPGQTWTT